MCRNPAPYLTEEVPLARIRGDRRGVDDEMRGGLAGDPEGLVAVAVGKPGDVEVGRARITRVHNGADRVGRCGGALLEAGDDRAGGADSDTGLGGCRLRL